MKSLLFSTALLAAITGSSVSAQSDSRPERAERSDQQAANQFLERKRSELNQSGDSLNRQGKPDLTGVARALIVSRRIPLPNPSRNLNRATLDELQGLFQIEVAQMMAQLGFNPGDLQQSPELVDAASNLVRGAPPYLDVAMLSDQIFEATVGEVNFSDLGDGFGSSVTFTELNFLKGEGLGAPIARQASRQIDADTRSLVGGDILERGARVRVLANRSLYNAQAGLRGGRSNTRNMTTVLAAYYITEGGEYLPLVSGMPKPEGE